jgi:hypothetical protein
VSNINSLSVRLKPIDISLYCPTDEMEAFVQQAEREEAGLETGLFVGNVLLSHAPCT